MDNADSPSSPIIYKATYSHIDVYEMLVQGNPVMRRKSDSYMNVTQILKIAGLDKNKRTKILEKEILIGEHEKVQGGYGKFQGTWIPLEKGREVAERYGVLELLLPILDFDPSNLNDNQIPTKDEVRSTLRAQSSQNNEQTPYLLASPALSPAMSMDSPASPYASSPSSTGYYSSLPMTRPSPQEDQPNHHPRKKQKTVQTVAPRPEPPQTTILQDPNRQRTFLMNLFLTEDTFEASDWLKEKIPRGLDLNIPIDDQGHTALHWAASLGRIKTLELLISGGADIRRTNASGETPLMRCVMMTNAYNVHCFPRILDNLYDSLMVTDNKKRSILHHISLTAGIPGRCSAAIHYLSSVVNATRDFEQAQTLYSMRDFNGDTAFDLAKKSGCKQIVDIFLRRDEDEKSLVEQKNGVTSANYTDKPALTEIHRFYNPRAVEVASNIQLLIEALDKDYSEKLKAKDEELWRTRGSLSTIVTQLREAKSRLGEHGRDIQINTPAWITESSTETDADSIPEHAKSSREKLLEQKIKFLQDQLDTQDKTHQEMKARIKELEAQSDATETKCKQLIAACSGLPLEKVDLLVDPMLAAVQSDPPDLDFMQVVRFMETLRQQHSQLQQ